MRYQTAVVKLWNKLGKDVKSKKLLEDRKEWEKIG